jgi:hypothetical protein
MLQPSKFESPVLVTSSKDTEAELLGRFHYITLVRNRPRTVGTWRVTTTSQLIADRVAQLLGGHVERNPRRNQFEILTTSSTVEVLLSGPDALYIRWQRDDRSTCDGVIPADRHPCRCPVAVEQRRAAAKQGDGCQPRAEVRFHFRDDQLVGVFGLASGDWSFVELVATAQAALSSRDAGGLVRAQLELRRSLHTLHSGMVLPYTRPVLTVLSDYRSTALVNESHDPTGTAPIASAFERGRFSGVGQVG